MTKSKALVPGSADKTIPAKYGPEVEPNYYCRGRNGKHRKYCKSRAGCGTDHVGHGRCRKHGGSNQNAAKMKHGKYSKIVHPEVLKLVAAHEQDGTTVKDKMLRNLNHTLALRDYALATYAEKPTEELLDQIVRYNDLISKSGYRLEQIRAHGTVSIDRIKLFMIGLYGLIEGEVSDKDLAKRLKLGIGKFRV